MCVFAMRDAILKTPPTLPRIQYGGRFREVVYFDLKIDLFLIDIKKSIPYDIWYQFQNRYENERYYIVR